MHFDNKDILSLSERTTQGLNDTTKYRINFTQPRKRFVLSLRYNGSNSFVFVNVAKMYQFKIRDFEMKDYTLYFGNISNDFTVNNMKKKMFVDFNHIDTNNILAIDINERKII